MERLNDIMGRAPSRRQLQAEQHLQPGAPAQGGRSPQSQHPGTRRPLPEQTARLGQRPAYGSQARPTHAAPNTRHLTGQSRPGMPDEQEPAAYDDYEPAPTRSRSPLNREATHRTAPQQEPQRVQPFQPQRAQGPQGQALQRRQTGGYHRPDDYAQAPQGDVINDWADEEDEDDDAGMGYGDWEKEDPDEVVVYKRGDLEVIPNPRSRQQPALREGANAYIEPAPTRPTRNLRDLRIPTTIPHPTEPAQPAARTQEVQRYQRTTQPLDPRTITGIGQQRDYAQGAQRAPQARPPQPVPTREQVQQPAYSAPPMNKNICPRCRGAGYLRANVPFGHPNFGKPIPCECKEAERKEKRRQQLRAMSNLDAHRGQNLRTFNTRIPGVQEAYQAAIEFAESPEGWLLLVGPNGCGKTHLAVAIANEALDSGAVVLFAVVPDLLDHLRAAFAPTATEVYDQLFSKMREAELLVLDDLGAQQSSPWANEKLFQLLNYRYNMGMPTVITANPRGIQSIDERIRSRLQDHSLVVSVSMDRARDYRPTNPRRP